MALDKIKTAMIEDDAVTAAKIPAGAVGTSEIADGTVVAADIGADAVGTTELANDVTISTSGNIATTGSGTLTVAGTSTLTGNATASGNLTVTGDIVPSTPLSHRNIVINGGMQVWQRATAATAASGNYHTVDRWKIYEVGDGAYTSEKHTMSLAELNTTGHKTALKLVVTTVDSAIAADAHAYITTRFEAQDLQHLQYGTANAKTITLSFWVKSNKTGVYSAHLDKSAESGTRYQLPHEYTISSADTWEQKTIIFTPTAGSTALITGAGGVIDKDHDVGLSLQFG